ncbi:MAG: tRNA (guanosine(37)-N1)-methyltransferase TrmD [Bacillota bacterium]
MRVDIVTIFPGMFRGPLQESMVARARETGRVEIGVVDLRDYTEDRHRVTDDEPYGGGPGMVMKPEPFFKAVQDLSGPRSRVVLMCPQGEPYDQRWAERLSREEHLILLCGHYEGIDERVRLWADYEISLGDFILTGGEIAAMAVVDSVVRLLPGVLGHASSTSQDSFAQGLLEGPQYTRPREFRGHAVPGILLSGNHDAIRRWRRKEGLRRTLERRPDLLKKADLNEEDTRLLQEIGEETMRPESP